MVSKVPVQGVTIITLNPNHELTDIYKINPNILGFALMNYTINSVKDIIDACTVTKERISNGAKIDSQLGDKIFVFCSIKFSVLYVDLDSVWGNDWYMHIFYEGMFVQEIQYWGKELITRNANTNTYSLSNVPQGFLTQ